MKDKFWQNRIKGVLKKHLDLGTIGTESTSFRVPELKYASDTSTIELIRKGIVPSAYTFEYADDKKYISSYTTEEMLVAKTFNIEQGLIAVTKGYERYLDFHPKLDLYVPLFCNLESRLEEDVKWVAKIRNYLLKVRDLYPQYFMRGTRSLDLLLHGITPKEIVYKGYCLTPIARVLFQYPLVGQEKTSARVLKFLTEFSQGTLLGMDYPDFLYPIRYLFEMNWYTLIETPDEEIIWYNKKGRVADGNM